MAKQAIDVGRVTYTTDAATTRAVILGVVIWMRAESSQRKRAVPEYSTKGRMAYGRMLSVARRRRLEDRCDKNSC